MAASNQLYSWAALNQDIPAATVNKVISAKSSLLDEMGIYQHHDAVTGTARQDVADDYAFRLHKALKKNHEAYGEVTDILLEKFAGLSSNSTWQFCERTNGTYLDCPIREFKRVDDNELFVALHNPSSLEYAALPAIQVPDGHFRVMQWSFD